LKKLDNINKSIKDSLEFQAFVITYNLNLHFLEKGDRQLEERNGISDYYVDFLLQERDRKKY